MKLRAVSLSCQRLPGSTGSGGSRSASMRWGRASDQSPPAPRAHPEAVHAAVDGQAQDHRLELQPGLLFDHRGGEGCVFQGHAVVEDRGSYGLDVALEGEDALVVHRAHQVVPDFLADHRVPVHAVGGAQLVGQLHPGRQAPAEHHLARGDGPRRQVTGEDEQRQQHGEASSPVRGALPPSRSPSRDDQMG